MNIEKIRQIIILCNRIIENNNTTDNELLATTHIKEYLERMIIIYYNYIV